MKKFNFVKIKPTNPNNKNIGTFQKCVSVHIFIIFKYKI